MKVLNMQPIGHLQQTNDFSMPCDRKIFMANIFLKLSNLCLAPDYDSPQGKIEYTLIYPKFCVIVEPILLALPSKYKMESEFNHEYYL